jgi:membrane-associated phospholipid phosphatase
MSPSAAPDRALFALRIYLVGIALPMLVAWHRGAPAWLPALHLLGLIAASLVQRQSERSATWARWGSLLPLVAIPLLYAELQVAIAALHGAMRDTSILALESALFGEPARTFAAHVRSRLVSELLHLGYLSYYPLIYVPPLLYAIRSRTQALRESVLAVTIAYTVCFAIFVVFPVEGPRFRFGVSPHVPDGPFRDIARALLEAGSSRGTAFPSSHVAVSAAQAIAAVRHSRQWGWIVAVCAAGIALGAVYGGFHYATDVVAGAAVGAAAAVAARRFVRD